MEIRGPTLVLIGAAAIAAGWAIWDQSRTPATSVAAPEPTMTADPVETTEPAPVDTMPAPDEEPAAITWKPPAGWQVAQNPNPMRIATYHPPPAKGDPPGAEVIVARAGGSVDANIDRWLGQFDAPENQSRSKTKVAGFDTTFVEVSGTYEGGMSMNDPSPKPEPGWTLRGAIVETPGTSYFFKMIGPNATIAAARPGFDAMVRGIVAAPALHD